MSIGKIYIKQLILKSWDWRDDITLYNDFPEYTNSAGFTWYTYNNVSIYGWINVAQHLPHNMERVRLLA